MRGAYTAAARAQTTSFAHVVGPRADVAPIFDGLALRLL
jgi:hypothetical protein